jgi:hypothetical protein
MDEGYFKDKTRFELLWNTLFMCRVHNDMQYVICLNFMAHINDTVAFHH